MIIDPYEKFSLGCRELAVSRDPIQERVASAFVQIAQVYGLLPRDIARKLEDFEAAWAGAGYTGGGSPLRIWARGLTDKEAEEVAGWIMDSAAELQRWAGTTSGRPTPIHAQVARP